MANEISNNTHWINMGNTSSLASPTHSTTPQALSFVRSSITKNCVVIFSKNTCPYSKMAKQTFDKLGMHYYVVDLDKRDDSDLIQNALLHITGERTVPRVFINGMCIGGGVDTQKLGQQGKLQDLLSECRGYGPHLSPQHQQKQS